MRTMRFFFLNLMVLLAVAVAVPSIAHDHYDTPGLVGFDPVAYFTDGKPMRGSGYHVTVYDGITYAFTSKEHKKLFEANPPKYLPAYGGYCAILALFLVNWLYILAFAALALIIIWLVNKAKTVLYVSIERR